MTKLEMLEELQAMVMAETKGQTDGLLMGYARLYGMVSGFLTETQIQALLQQTKENVKKS